MDQLILQKLIKNDQHLKNGFYIYNNKIYYNKIEPLIQASKDNSDIRWYFNDDEFRSFDWSSEPNESLVSLYKQRAINLRETYDHIVVMFSGGSDSTNVLRSFLDNNIKPDSIWSFIGHNHHIDKKYDRWNLEITLSAYPVLKEAQNKGIHIELPNLLEYDSILEEDWYLEDSGMRLSGEVRMRRNLFFEREDIKKLVEQGKKVCFILAHDKPRLRLIDNFWYFSFLDTWRVHHWTSQHKLPQGPFLEYFYFTTCPSKLLIKSCFMIIDFFEKHWTRSQCNNFWQEGNLYGNNVDHYNSIVNKILYKNTWNEGITFSMGKPKPPYNQIICQKSTFLLERWHEWHNFNEWYNGLKNVFSQLNPNFYKSFEQITGHWTEKYPIKALNCLKNF